MGPFSYSIAGGGFILIGALESLASSNTDPNSSLGTDPSLAPNQSKPSISPGANRSSSSSSSSSLSSIAVALFSSLFIINSLFSFFNALGSRDQVGSVLQLQTLAIGLLFLLYSIIGFMVKFKKAFVIPESITSLILLFGFVEEFLLFYLQRKDPSGIENRYFDLMLVPISICIFSTVLDLRSSKSNNYPKIACGIGLILQGTWFLQMGLSFFTGLISNGCSLHEKSRGNFTIRCKEHSDYHRARAIATLQFNCHLALIVALSVGFFSILAHKYGYRREELSNYRPLGAEMRQMENVGTFTLDSDEEDEVREESNEVKKDATVEMNVNGFRSHD